MPTSERKQKNSAARKNAEAFRFDRYHRVVRFAAFHVRLPVHTALAGLPHGSQS